ncbi:MAG: RNHCP domain-containing protein [bacterium]
MPRRFQRKKEDFTCAHCGFFVSGNGYTDHCPRCLWSLHCDINPGDRDCSCHGLMEPTGVEVSGGEHIIHYRCLSCGFKHRVKSLANDNYDEIVKLSNNYV